MSDREDLYILSVETMSRNQLLRITGERGTVIDAALRVIVDCAPDWKNRDAAFEGSFQVNIQKVKH